LPIVKWHVRKWGNTEKTLVEDTGLIYEYRRKYSEANEAPPIVWKRFTNDLKSGNSEGFVKPPENFVPSHLLKHELNPTTEFWYPIPLSDHLPALNRMLDSLLLCRTQRTNRYLDGRILIRTKGPVFSIRDREGGWVGALRLHEEHTLCQDTSQVGSDTSLGQLCELVAIFRGYAYEGSSGLGIAEWRHRERPKAAEKYEFYNVLWVEWLNGIAYRKAIGRVMKSAWEAQDLEWVDLTLG
jgi:hypothetical protein